MGVWTHFDKALIANRILPPTYFVRQDIYPLVAQLGSSLISGGLAIPTSEMRHKASGMKRKGTTNPHE